MAVLEAVRPVRETVRQPRQSIIGEKRKPIPLSVYVPERLIFTDSAEPTRRELLHTAQRVREAYRRSVEPSYKRAPSYIEPRPNPRAANINDILGYYQRRNPSRDFTNDAGLVNDLLLRVQSSLF